MKPLDAQIPSHSRDSLPSHMPYLYRIVFMSKKRHSIERFAKLILFRPPMSIFPRRVPISMNLLERGTIHDNIMSFIYHLRNRSTPRPKDVLYSLIVAIIAYFITI